MGHNSSSFDKAAYIMSSDNITNGVKRQDDECTIPSTNGDVTNKSTMTDTAMSSPLTKFLPKTQKVKDDYVYTWICTWVMCNFEVKYLISVLSDIFLYRSMDRHHHWMTVIFEELCQQDQRALKESYRWMPKMKQR